MIVNRLYTLVLKKECPKFLFLGSKIKKDRSTSLYWKININSYDYDDSVIFRSFLSIFSHRTYERLLPCLFIKFIKGQNPKWLIVYVKTRQFIWLYFDELTYEYSSNQTVIHKERLKFSWRLRYSNSTSFFQPQGVFKYGFI